MDDLRPSRPGPSAGIERYSPEEKKSDDKPVEKKIEKRKLNSAVAPLPPVEDDGEQDHRLDERA